MATTYFGMDLVYSGQQIGIRMIPHPNPKVVGWRKPWFPDETPVLQAKLILYPRWDMMQHYRQWVEMICFSFSCQVPVAGSGHPRHMPGHLCCL